MRVRFSPDALVGQTLLARGTRLFVEQVLRSGGLSHVLLARTPDDEHVVLKVLRPEVVDRAELVARFEREARAAALVQHPNVLRVFGGVERDRELSFFVSEHLVGTDLADLMAAERKLPRSRALRIVRGAARGLAAAHAAGVVHRDVKPENLFLVHALDGREVVRVLDFGSAWLLEDSQPAPDMRLTISTGFVGTPGYLAPEQAEGREGHASADIYSLGVVLFELLVGRAPFTAKTSMDLVQQHMCAELPRVSGVSEALEATVRRALAKSPADRFASMYDLEQALLEAPEGAPSGS